MRRTSPPCSARHLRRTLLSADTMRRVPADRRPFMRGDDLDVQVVADVEHIAYYSCQPMGRGLCSKSRAAGAPRASRGLTGLHEAMRSRSAIYLVAKVWVSDTSAKQRAYRSRGMMHLVYDEIARSEAVGLRRHRQWGHNNGAMPHGEGNCVRNIAACSETAQAHPSPPRLAVAQSSPAGGTRMDAERERGRISKF